MIIKVVWTSQVVLVVKNLPAKARDTRDECSIPAWGRAPGGGKWQPMSVLLPGKFHGQKSLEGCSPWGHKELDTTERLNTQHTQVQLLSRVLHTLPPLHLHEQIYLSPRSSHNTSRDFKYLLFGCTCPLVPLPITIWRTYSKYPTTKEDEFIPRKMNNKQTSGPYQFRDLQFEAGLPRHTNTPSQTRQVLATAQTT